MKKIAIIGYGDFGKLWADILSKDFSVVVTGGSNYHQKAIANNHTPVTLEEALYADVIFYAVPISVLETVIQEHMEFLTKNQLTPLIIDLLSVKVHPKKVFEKTLQQQIPFLLCHPMFWPMSFASNNGLHGFNIVLCPTDQYTEEFDFWKQYFKSKELVVHELTAEEHDKEVARTQAITHYISQILNRYGIENSSINTKSARDLTNVAHSLKQDGGRLFRDMMKYNPYVRDEIQKIHASTLEVEKEFIQNHV